MDHRNLKSGWAACLLVLFVLLVAPRIAQAACDDEAKAIKDVVDDWEGDMAQLQAQQDKAMATLSLKDYPLGHVKLSTALANKAFDLIKAGDLRG